MPTTVVFLGSKPIGYDCLQYLMEHGTLLDISVTAIRTRSRSEFGTHKDLRLLAEKYNIPIVETLDALPECDIIYSVQHHELLKQEHLNKARKIAVNLHLAPLPEYRGCNQFSFAIVDEAKEFGVSIHEIDTRIDHGDILFQSRFPIPEACWVEDLYRRTVAEGFKLFQATISDLVSGQYRRKSQQELIARYGGTLHFRSEIQSLKEINLDAPEVEIEKRIRATYMPGFEPPFCRVGGKKFFFQRE